MMKWRRFVMILRVLNLLLLTFVVLAQIRPVAAQGTTPVLRGRALELVDDAGLLRAEIKVLPAQPKFKMADGTMGYLETVQLRLFTSKGGPNVKLVATEDGSGLVLGGELGYVQILSRREGPFLKLFNKDGREQTFTVQGPAT